MTYNRCTAFPHVRQEIFSFHVNAQARVDAGFRTRPTGRLLWLLLAHNQPVAIFGILLLPV